MCILKVVCFQFNAFSKKSAKAAGKEIKDANDVL